MITRKDFFKNIVKITTAAFIIPFQVAKEPLPKGSIIGSWDTVVTISTYDGATIDDLPDGEFTVECWLNKITSRLPGAEFTRFDSKGNMVKSEFKEIGLHND